MIQYSLKHAKAAERTLLEAKTLAEKHYDATVRQAANIARKRIRGRMPSARGLPAGSHYASGTPRRAGDMKKAVSISTLGFGFSGGRKVSAGGSAHILIPGAKEHAIVPKTASVLSLPAGFTTGKKRGTYGAVAFASVQHPSIAAHPYVEEGYAAALPEIEALVAATGQKIVAEMALQIKAGGL